MTRKLALVWLLVVVAAAAYLGWRAEGGLTFRTDLMALLPREQQNPQVQDADDAVTTALSQRIFIMVGHADRATARAAARDLIGRLDRSGLTVPVSSAFDGDRLRRMGQFYFPYRRGLLAEGDRRDLETGKADQVALRALSQVFGFFGATDAKLLAHDPFLLLQGFFVHLPVPLSHLALDDGLLTTSRDGTTWILVTTRLTGEPYALDIQRQLAETLNLNGLTATYPGLDVLRLGAVFFAAEGARQAMAETTIIGLLSTLGTILVVLAAFRALGPLWLTLLAVLVGIGVALAASLLLFGELHVAALLFGASLIGVAVDYSLQYCTEIFAPPAEPALRLRRVFVGIGLGAATSVIGYLTLFLAPFPGLHQIAAFSAIGLIASWLTVVLWLPPLDRLRPPRHGARMLDWANRFLGFWVLIRTRRWRTVLPVVLLALTAGGAWRFHVDDDVHHMQSLSPELLREQADIQSLIGSTTGNQFFLVQGQDDEEALRREEALATRLEPLVAERALAGFLAPAQFVPSAARQVENRALVSAKLDGLAAQQMHRLGLVAKPEPTDDSLPPLALSDALRFGGPLAFLSSLVLKPGLHVVSLDGVRRPDVVAGAAAGLDGVRFIDPADDFSRLLGKYRERAIGLLALSALVMVPLLGWRYKRRTGLVMVPPLLAVVLTPLLRALAGAPFTFFDAMALVLVLAIGVDYAVFCAETSGTRRPVTLVAVALAATTALLSFGLLASSAVAAVHAFGTSMLLGVLLSFVFAPLACRPDGGRHGIDR